MAQPLPASSAPSSSAPPEPQVEEEPQIKGAPTSGDIQASLKKIHDRLKNETELYKLHLKHYHMSSKSFRHRTSSLKLPKEVYDKYDMVVKKCACLLYTSDAADE